MKLARFMDDAYQGKAAGRRLKTQQWGYDLQSGGSGRSGGNEALASRCRGICARMTRAARPAHLLPIRERSTSFSGDIYPALQPSGAPGLCGFPPGIMPGWSYPRAPSYWMRRQTIGKGPCGREDERRQDPRAAVGWRLSGPGDVRRRDSAPGCRGLCLPEHARWLWRSSGRCRQIPGSGQLWWKDSSARGTAARGRDG